MQEADREESLHAEEAWRAPLEQLELTLSEVSKAIGALRDALEHGEAGEPAPPPLHVVEVEETEDETSAVETGLEASNVEEQTEGAAEQTDDAAEEAEGAEDSSAPADFQNVWQRLQREREERSADGAATLPEPSVGGGDAAVDADADDVGQPSEVLSAEQEIAGSAVEAEGDSRPTNFRNVWQRLQHEREERSAAPLEEVADVRGLGNLPKSYRMTIEDRDGTPVDLIPIHRALLAFAPADDVSLVSFTNGTAVISMRTTEKLDLEQLSSVISAATSRECEVIEQAQGKLFLRLTVEEDAEQGSDG